MMTPQEQHEMVRLRRASRSWMALAAVGLAACAYLTTVENPEPALPDCPTDRVATVRCVEPEHRALIGTTTAPAAPGSPVVCVVNGKLVETGTIEATEAGLTPCGPFGPPEVTP